jgi:hypothetical protein
VRFASAGKAHSPLTLCANSRLRQHRSR